MHRPPIKIGGLFALYDFAICNSFIRELLQVLHYHEIHDIF